MTLSSTRGLVRVSINPECDVQAAMAVERVREPIFYRQVTGAEFPGEYGERLSARRRGAKFEAALHANDAAGLRDALHGVYGLNPLTATVRNFADEVPGPPTTMRAMRLVRTRGVLQDLVAGRAVPDVLIQPQLRLPTGPGRLDFEHISPDFMVMDRATGWYVPGEEKSFIVRDDVADPGDLDLPRRQAAAQILALRAEAVRFGVADRVHDRAVFVFATPYGMRPAPGREEHLAAEVHALGRAVGVYARVRAELAARRDGQFVSLANLVDELPTRFQESCLSSCLLASRCESAHVGTARVLGDRASRLLADADLDELAAALADRLSGRPDRPGVTGRSLDRLVAEAAALGFDPADTVRRLA